MVNTGSKQCRVTQCCIASSFRWNRKLMKVDVSCGKSNSKEDLKAELSTISETDDSSGGHTCVIARTAHKFKHFASSRGFNMKDSSREGDAAKGFPACPCLLRMRKRDETICSEMNKPFKRKTTCVLGRLARRLSHFEDGASTSGDTATTAQTSSTGRSLPSLQEEETEEKPSRQPAAIVLQNDQLRFELGALHIMNGDLEKAEKCIMEAMEIRTALHGRNHEKVAACHELLGDIAHRREQFEQAKQRYNIAVNTIRMRRGVRDESVSRILLKLATVYEELGEEARATDARRKGHAALH